MNKHYLKILLYTYGVAEKRIKVIDEQVEKRALKSINDFSPSFDQCLKIVQLTMEKEKMFDVIIATEKVLPKLKQDEYELLEYRYFRKRPRQEMEDVKSNRRDYFRRQEKVLSILNEEYEKIGFSDEYFVKEFLPLDFIMEISKRVREHDVSYCKKVIINKKRRKYLPVSKKKKKIA